MEKEKTTLNDANTVDVSGLSYHYGEKSQTKVAPREIEKKPTPRAEKIRELFLKAKSSVSMEFPYWYSRRWFELEGEITIIRRAEALKSAFSHLTPAIFPGELLVMGKVHYLRGSYPMPWLSEAYYMSVEDNIDTIEQYRSFYNPRYGFNYFC